MCLQSTHFLVMLNLENYQPLIIRSPIMLTMPNGEDSGSQTWKQMCSLICGVGKRERPCQGGKDCQGARARWVAVMHSDKCRKSKGKQYIWMQGQPRETQRRGGFAAKADNVHKGASSR